MKIPKDLKKVLVLVENINMEKDLKFDFNDITIVPENVSLIESRTNVSIYDENGRLPFFVAPMDMVLNVDNYTFFDRIGLNICMPRGEYVKQKGIFNSYSLNDFIKMVDSGVDLNNEYVHIDIANGHMNKLINAIRIGKTKYPEMVLMVGNIANPKTFVELAKAGADYVKCGVGGGSACTSSSNTGIHYPYGSLINEVKNLKDVYGLNCKIIADGGIKGYADAIKALALGADYVMMGSLFNKCIEACSDTLLFKKIKLPYWLAFTLYKKGFKLWKRYRGMSTKEVQIKWNRERLTTSEGISKFNRVETDLTKFMNNLNDYLKSAMSYTNSNSLNDFIGNVQFVKITDNAFKRFNK